MHYVLRTDFFGALTLFHEPQTTRISGADSYFLIPDQILN